MGADWYDFISFVGNGVFVSMKSILRAWVKEAPEKSCKRMGKKKLNDSDKKMIHEWILGRLPAREPGWNINLVANRFVFIGCGEKLRKLKPINVLGPYETQSYIVSMELIGSCDVTGHAKLVEAARALVLADSELEFNAGKWLISATDCFLVLNGDFVDSNDDEVVGEAKVDDKEDQEDDGEDEEDDEEDQEDDGEDQEDSDSDPSDRPNKRVKKADGTENEDKEAAQTWEGHPIRLPDHPALTDPRFFDISFQVGPSAILIQCNRVYLATNNRIFCGMFSSEWKQSAQDEAIVYQDFHPQAFRIVLAFIISVKPDERQAIAAALEDFPATLLEDIIKVADYFGETVLNTICLQARLTRSRKTFNGIKIDRFKDAKWRCFHDESS